MAEADRAEAQIYQLRGVIRGISPMIWRRLLVRDDRHGGAVSRGIADRLRVARRALEPL
jgi:hypothetical protein